jgi:hypothetical protein
MHRSLDEIASVPDKAAVAGCRSRLKARIRDFF